MNQLQKPMCCCFPDSLNLRTVCNELGVVEDKAYQIGIQLGVSHSKMKMFMKEEYCLSAAVDYWLRGNTEVIVCWESVVAALESKQVGEPGPAGVLRAKYCGQQDGVQDDNS